MNRWLPRFSLFLLLCVILYSCPEPSFAFRRLGTPVKEPVSWGVRVGPGKTGKMDALYISFAQYGAPLFLLRVNPNTAEMEQFNGPLASEMGSWGYTIDHEKRIYLGSYYDAHLLRFDPKTGKWDDLGQLGGEKESFVCSLTTAPDGKIWGGTFPSAKLFSYDPKTGQSQDFGRMDPDQFYCYPTAGEDGLIYCAIQFEKKNIVIFDPEKGTKTSVLSPENRRPGRVRLVKGNDGKMYAGLSSQEGPDQWFRIEGGKGLTEISRPEVPFPKTDLPDGQQFYLVENRALRIRNPDTNEEKEIPLQYDAAGSYVFVVETGPDGRVYGGSMLPLRLFVYDPQDDSLTNLGKAAHANGEIYSMGVLDDRLYLCSYPEARLSVYDPKKPLRFGDAEDSNPRDLGSMGDGQYRPRAMLTGPHGKVYVGGYPDYGLLGGALGVYDPKKNEKKGYRHIIQNQSVASLAYVEKFDLLAVGSSVRGGSGTHAVEKEAKLMLWDPKEEKKVFEIVPVPEARTVLSLAATGDGLLYGITEKEDVFVLDVEKREVKKIFHLGLKEPAEISLRRGFDGRLYGLAKEAIFVINPANDQVTLLGHPPSPITSGMAMVGRKIYYGSGADLYEFEIPEDPLPTDKSLQSPIHKGEKSTNLQAPNHKQDPNSNFE